MFSIGSANSLIVKNAHIVDSTYISGEFTPVVLLFMVYFLGLLVAAFIKLFSRYRTAFGIQKNQLQYALIGFLLFFIPFVITNLILPNIFGIFKYNNLGPSFTLPMVGLIAYSIIRHRFLDVRIVIQRGLVFTALLGMLLTIYLLTVFLLRITLQVATNIADFISAALVLALGIFGAPVIEKYFRRWTDRIFFKDQYDYSEAVEDVSEILNKNLELEDIIHKLRDILKAIFRVQETRFALLPDDKQLNSDGRLESFKKNYSDQPLNKLIKNSEIVVTSEIPYLLDDPHISDEYKKTLREIREFAVSHHIAVV
ncbi:MAG: hypothetical protein GTO02_08555, partial [Candidatus Dadabacteria bacterium]|nr:hypothetical protein [Candidatus Dadabacteria bacterium]